MPKKGIDIESKKLFIETLVKINGEDFLDFFDSLLSSAELKDISRRLMAAKLLHQESTYDAVVKLMGMGSNTVNKIHFKTKGSPVLKKLFKTD